MSNTLTDNYDGTIEIIDKSRYNELSIEEKKLFESIRNSALETFPIVDSKYDNETIKFAENLAFIQLPGITNYVSFFVSEEIKKLKELINIEELEQVRERVLVSGGMGMTNTTNTNTTGVNG